MTNPRPRWQLFSAAFITGIAIGILCWTLLIEPMRRANAAEGAMAMLKDQEAAWNRHDLNGFLKAYDMTDKISFFSDDIAERGWEGVKDRYQNGYGKDPDKLMGKLSFTELQADTFSSDTVMIRGRWTTTQTPKANTGLFSIIVRKTDSGWKVIHDHTSVKKEVKK